MGDPIRINLIGTGWAILWHTHKWHYFVKGIALCGKHTLLGGAHLPYMTTSVDLEKSQLACKDCSKKLLKLKEQ